MDLYLPTIYQKINSFSYQIPVNVFIYSSHMFCYVIESIFFSESRWYFGLICRRNYYNV